MSLASALKVKQVLWPLEPYPDESLMGFVARVAAHNVIENTFAITSQAGQDFGHRVSLVYSPDADLETLARVLRVDERQLRIRAHPTIDGRSLFFGIRLPNRALETKRRLFSPSSLAANPYHRAGWQNRLTPFCPESWEHLIDSCGACGVVQRFYSAAGVDKCDACGEALTGIVASQVPQGLRGSLEFVANLSRPSDCRRKEAMSRVPPRLADMDPGDLLELISYVGRLPSMQAGNGWAPITRAEPVDTRLELLASSADLVLGWPDAPRAEIEAILASRGGELGRGRASFVARFFRDSELTSLSPATRDAVRRLKDNLLTRAPTKEGPKAFAHVSDIHRLSGLKTGEAIAHRRAGRLKVVTYQPANGGFAAGFDPDELAQIGNVVRRGLSTSSVAAKLGITHFGVEQLVCLGVLEPCDHPVIVERYHSMRFDASSIDAFLEQLRAASCDRIVGPRIRSAVKCIGGPKPWGSIVLAMLEGRIRFDLGRGGRLISDATISESSVRELSVLAFDRRSFPNFEFYPLMNKQDAQEALNIAASSASSLDPGIVRARTESDNRIVSMKFVEQQAAMRVTAVELAARLNCSAANVRRMLSDADVTGETLLGWPRRLAERAVLYSNPIRAVVES